MINLFKTVSPVQVGILKPSLWELASQNLKDNVSTVQQYYRQATRYAQATHPLIRFLLSTCRQWELPLSQYVESITPELIRNAGIQGITTSATAGHAHHGTFYDHHITEYYLGYIGSFNEPDAEYNWQTLESVSVLYHPKSDLALPFLNGQPYSSETGVAVIGIDLLKLAIQYRSFQHVVSGDSEISASGVQVFIAKYVMPNMLESHIDLALFNRLMYKHYGVPYNGQVLTKHPMVLLRPDSYIDRVISTVLHNLPKINPEYHHQLCNIPSLYKSTMHEALLMPDILETTQCQWLLVLSKLKHLYQLVHFSEETSRVGLNRMALIEFKRMIKQHNVLPMLESKLPMEVFSEVQLELLGLDILTEEQL